MRIFMCMYICNTYVTYVHLCFIICTHGVYMKTSFSTYTHTETYMTCVHRHTCCYTKSRRFRATTLNPKPLNPKP